MSSEEKVVLYEDDFGHAEPGAVFYPQALRTIAEVLAELNGEEILRPRFFNQNIGLYLDLIVGRFRSFHETHRAAQTIHGAYRADNRQYCLYLRSFALAGIVLDTRSEHGRLVQQLGLAASDREFRGLVKAALPEGMESLSFINTFDLYPSGSEASAEGREHMRRATIASFRVLSHNWREIVREVVRGANFVVLNVQGETEGIDYELELVRDAGMAGRTIVARGRGSQRGLARREFYDVVDLGDAGDPDERIARDIRSLANDDFRQTSPVRDLSDLRCWVVDRGIEAAMRRFDEATLAGVPYDGFVPSSLASNWGVLTERFPRMIEAWQALEAKGERGGTPTTEELAEAMYLALSVFYVAVTLERYREMALALSIVGMAHRAITAEIDVMADCYRHAAQCAKWSDDAELAEFLADAHARLEQSAGRSEELR